VLICLAIGVGLIVLVAIFGPPAQCQLCSTSIRRTRYVWQLEGKKTHVCPNCNRRLELERSKTAMRTLLGSESIDRGKGRKSKPILSRSATEIIAETLGKIEAAKGPAGRRAALKAGLENLTKDSARNELMLEASRIEVSAVLDKVDGLKSATAKRRYLEAALNALRADEVPDDLQREQLNWQEAALGELEQGSTPSA
jgi:hypothetical protein